MIMATAPLVTAVAMLVPLSRKYLVPTRKSGYCAYSALLAAAIETSRCPGATRSGLAYPLYQAGPRELYGGTWSSARPAVSRVFAAPTVIAEGAFPGEVMPAYPTRPV